MKVWYEWQNSGLLERQRSTTVRPYTPMPEEAREILNAVSFVQIEPGIDLQELIKPLIGRTLKARIAVLREKGTLGCRPPLPLFYSPDLPLPLSSEQQRWKVPQTVSPRTMQST
jgi:hypothetical protein